MFEIKNENVKKIIWVVRGGDVGELVTYEKVSFWTFCMAVFWDVKVEIVVCNR